jgi:putative aldouronate transport system permease protein
MTEGAGYFTILIRLVLPLSMPVVATIAIFSAVMQWNSYRDNLFLAPSINLETLQYLLYRFLKESSASQIRSVEEIKDLSQRITPISVRMAITIIVTVPVTLVYPFLQKYFMSGIMLGAIKG